MHFSLDLVVQLHPLRSSVSSSRLGSFSSTLSTYGKSSSSPSDWLMSAGSFLSQVIVLVLTVTYCTDPLGRLPVAKTTHQPTDSPDSHLNEEIDSESPLWSTAGELCHSFQTCCCQLALKKTHFQPTWATGLRHPCSSKLAASLLERARQKERERERSCQLDSWNKGKRFLNG